MVVQSGSGTPWAFAATLHPAQLALANVLFGADSRQKGSKTVSEEFHHGHVSRA